MTVSAVVLVGVDGSCHSRPKPCSLGYQKQPLQSLNRPSRLLRRRSRPGVVLLFSHANDSLSSMPTSCLPPLGVIDPVIYVPRLQSQIRQNADALANAIVLEQGKTFAGSYPPCTQPSSHTYSFNTDAHGDVLRGLQVVETACNIPTALMGDKIEVSRDMDTETRRLPIGVCARSVLWKQFIVDQG